MKVLLDANIQHDLRHSRRMFDVRTAHCQGVAHLVNGELLAYTENHAFDVLVTLDQNMDAQNDLSARRLAVICCKPRTQAMSDLAALAPQLVATIREAKPGSYTVVGPD